MSKSNKIVTLSEKLARKEEISKINQKSGCHYKALWKTPSICNSSKYSKELRMLNKGKNGLRFIYPEKIF